MDPPAQAGAAGRPDWPAGKGGVDARASGLGHRPTPPRPSPRRPSPRASPLRRARLRPRDTSARASSGRAGGSDGDDGGRPSSRRTLRCRPIQGWFSPDSSGRTALLQPAHGRRAADRARRRSPRLRPRPVHATMRQQVNAWRGWLNRSPRRWPAGRSSCDVRGAAATHPPCGRAASDVGPPTPTTAPDADLKARALADGGVQAMLDLFPVRNS